jgi:hypothetical protein
MSDEEQQGAGCISECLGCATTKQLQATMTLMSDEDIAAAIEANMNEQTPNERKAVNDFAEDRARFESPFHKEYAYALEMDANFRTIFSISLMQTTVWVDSWFMDLFYYIVASHPLLGYFAHEAHPLEIADRSLIIVAGVTICLVNQVTPQCRVLTENSCFSAFINNGMCEDGGNYTWMGSEAEPKLFACDYGTDFADCGSRDEHIWRSTVTSGHADGAGIWCFSEDELYFKIIAVAFVIIPLVMMLITKLILCECCITNQNNKQRIFWTDFGQNAGNTIVLALCAGCGYFVNGDEISIIDLGFTQAIIYGTILAVNFVTFVMAYKLEKRDIARHKGIENHTKAKMSLDGMFDDHSVGDK